MDIDTSIPVQSKKSRIISTVLSPALQLWLRSQVEQVESLQFKIMGGDRQILSGQIPMVSIAARGAVYQGLQLSQLQLEGSCIRVNLGQVIKGKPLRLLEPFPVLGQLLLLERDLQASLQAPLLSKALTDLLATFLKSDEMSNFRDSLNNQPVTWQNVDIEEEKLSLFGTFTDALNQTIPVVILAGLQLTTPQVLRLNPLQIQLSSTSVPFNLDGLEIDLGEQVDLHELALTPGQLRCRGRLIVLP